jgi:hypothetical protein
MDTIFSVFVVAMVAWVLGPLTYRWFRYKSFSAAMFKAPIERTLGEVTLQSSAMSSYILRVHALGPSSEQQRFVGLQIISQAPLAASMTPINLSFTQARELAAIGRRSPTIRSSSGTSEFSRAVTPNPSLHRTRSGGLTPPTRAGELCRSAHIKELATRRAGGDA